MPEGEFGKIDILDMGLPEWDNVKTGQLSAQCGKASMAYLEMAMQLALKP